MVDASTMLGGGFEVGFGSRSVLAWERSGMAVALIDGTADNGFVSEDRAVAISPEVPTKAVVEVITTGAITLSVLVIVLLATTADISDGFVTVTKLVDVTQSDRFSVKVIDSPTVASRAGFEAV